MTRKEIISGLGEILEEVCGVHPDDVTEAATFVEDLDVDSLSMIEVIVVAEEKFEVKILDEEVEGVKTVGEAVDYILRRATAHPECPNCTCKAG